MNDYRKVDDNAKDRLKELATEIVDDKNDTDQEKEQENK